MKVVKDNFFKLFIDLLLLTYDDIPFSLNRAILQLRVLQNVRDDVDGDGDILSETLGVIDGLFA